MTVSFTSTIQAFSPSRTTTDSHASAPNSDCAIRRFGSLIKFEAIDTRICSCLDNDCGNRNKNRQESKMFGFIEPQSQWRREHSPA